MSGNPFSITSEDLLKKLKGVETSTTNTQEVREAKETQKIKSTDIYTLSKEYGGSNADKGFEFKNYDGFERTTTEPVYTKETQQEKQGKGLLSATNNATSEAKAGKSECQGYQEQAENDVDFVTKNVAKQKQAANKMKSEVGNNVKQRDALLAQNESAKSEVDSLNAEIEQLMAEDGQTYVAQEAVEVAMPEVKAQGSSSNNAQQGSMGGNSQGFASVGNSGNQNSGQNEFAMLSLPSGNAPQTVSTSITAVSAQNNSQNQQNNVQNNNQQSTQSRALNNNQQKSAAKAGSSSNSLAAFGSQLVSASGNNKGKNADKVNDLLQQVGAKNASITANSSKAASLTSQGATKANSFKAQLDAIVNQTVTKKSTNADNHDGAQIAQNIGLGTSLTGGIATSVGGAMMVWGDKVLGTKLVAGGGVATAAGSATSSIASATQGDLEAAANTMNTGLNSFNQTMNTYKTEVASLNNTTKKKS